LRLALAIVALTASCSQQAAPSRPQAWYCAGGYQFVAEAGKDQARVTLPDKTVTLAAAPSASGAKYSDGQVTFWNKGSEAMLEMGSESYRGCTVDETAGSLAHAKQSGADFHAAGGEPGWTLDIVDKGHTTLVTAYGKNRYEFSTPQPQQTSGETRYEANQGGAKIEITIEHRPCRGLSGLPSEATVRVEVEGSRYQGCGNWL
jgi:membrane-bound inhibitor of C-type lysozyme